MCLKVAGSSNSTLIASTLHPASREKVTRASPNMRLRQTAWSVLWCQ